MILAIESSCDETAAALVDRDGALRASVVASQAQLHARYGGVVPEVASRRHLELCIPVVERALERLGRDGNGAAHVFGGAMAGRPGFDFSFSGLKTALRNAVMASGGSDAERADLAASYQRAIVRSLVSRTMQAVEASRRETLA